MEQPRGRDCARDDADDDDDARANKKQQHTLYVLLFVCFSLLTHTEAHISVNTGRHGSLFYLTFNY